MTDENPKLRQVSSPQAKKSSQKPMPALIFSIASSDLRHFLISCTSILGSSKMDCALNY